MIMMKDEDESDINSIQVSNSLKKQIKQLKNKLIKLVQKQFKLKKIVKEK